MNVNFIIVLIPMLIYHACTNPTNRIEQNHKEIVNRVVNAINSGTFDQLDQYVGAAFERHCQATPQVQINSLEAFKAFLHQDRLAVPDQNMELRYLVAEDDLVAYWGTYQGTQSGQMGPFPPADKFVQLEFSGVHRFENGKIIETWITWDNLAMLTQLGHLSPDQIVPKE